MEVTLAVLADASNVSREGKLNILGVFDRIWAKSFPATHPLMQLVLRLECGPGEFGSEKPLRVILLDADGKLLGSIDGQLQIGKEQGGLHFKMDASVPLKNTRFEKPGEYAIHILVGGETKKVVPLVLAQLAQQEGPA